MKISKKTKFGCKNVFGIFILPFIAHIYFTVYCFVCEKYNKCTFFNVIFLSNGYSLCRESN